MEALPLRQCGAGLGRGHVGMEMRPPVSDLHRFMGEGCEGRFIG